MLPAVPLSLSFNRLSTVFIYASILSNAGTLIYSWVLTQAINDAVFAK